jgi:dipeptidyl aminopeptidase/acylaminoacyl peptidase
MEYSPPQVPSESGRFDGMAYHLWLPPAREPVPAVVVFHGAGSQKENHADFARAAVAHGFAALTFDNRGHGETEGELGPGVVHDLVRLVRFLRERPEVDERRIAVRGSSMGGLLALHLAAASDSVAAVVAICPAAEWMLLDDVRRAAAGRKPLPGSYLDSMRIDARALVAWLEENEVTDAVERLGAKPLLLIHAKGDETVPYTHSEELFARAAEPKRLLLLEGGDHRSAQHDAEIQGESLRWLARAMRPAA